MAVFRGTVGGNTTTHPVVIVPQQEPVIILRHDKHMIRDAYFEKDKEENDILVIRQTNISEDGLNSVMIKVFRLVPQEVIALFNLIDTKRHE